MTAYAASSGQKVGLPKVEGAKIVSKSAVVGDDGGKQHLVDGHQRREQPQQQKAPGQPKAAP